MNALVSRPASARRGRIVAGVGLAVYLALVLAILLSPVSPENLVAWATGVLRDDVGLTDVRQGWVEFAANVALFAPFGALVTLVFRRAVVGVSAALALSVGAELVQALLPGRLASARDVLANVAGAAIGIIVVLAVRAAARHRRKDTP